MRRTECQLNEREWERVTGCQAVARLLFGFRAIVDVVQDLVGSKSLFSFLNPQVVDGAGETEKVVWEVTIHGEEKVNL